MRTLPQNHLSANFSRRDALRILGLAGATAAFVPNFLRASEAAAPASKPATALSLSGAQPGFYRFRIGELEALAISDGRFPEGAVALHAWAGSEAGLNAG